MILISAGHGSSTASDDGGDGGALLLYGGKRGAEATNDAGGNIEIVGGCATAATGGSLMFQTGSGAGREEMFTCGPQTAPFLAVAAFLAQFLLRQAQQLWQQQVPVLRDRRRYGWKGGNISLQVGTGDLAMAAICTFMRRNTEAGQTGSCLSVLSQVSYSASGQNGGSGGTGDDPRRATKGNR